MKISYPIVQFLFLARAFASLPQERSQSSDESILLPRKDKSGRQCNVCGGCKGGGYYVGWEDTRKAAADWCRAHSGNVVSVGGKVDDGVIKGFKSNHWNVALYVKYQNDHVESGWTIDEEACNWYIGYIAQGCTKGGNMPTKKQDQVTDGGSYFEPNMGSIFAGWMYSRDEL